MVEDQPTSGRDLTERERGRTRAGALQKSRSTTPNRTSGVDQETGQHVTAGSEMKANHHLMGQDHLTSPEMAQKEQHTKPPTTPPLFDFQSEAVNQEVFRSPGNRVQLTLKQTIFSS